MQMKAFKTINRTIAIFGCLLAASTAFSQVSFQDDFEATTIDPFWTATFLDFGTIALSTEQSQSGVQSVKYSSISGGQRNLYLTHTFATPIKGTATVKLYDSDPGVSSQYRKIDLRNSLTGLIAQIGIEDFDATCYSALVFTPGGGRVGPNANCGVFPQQSTTNVLRSLGWHTLGISFSDSSITLSIDGTDLFDFPGDYEFDEIHMLMQAPSGRPNTVAYFDDFSLQPVQVQYNFTGFFSPVENPPVLNSAKAGSAVPVKFSLGGDQGLGIFAQGYPKSQQIACDSSAPINDVQETMTAGNSSLSYDPESDQYTYVWKTDRAWAGTCRQLIVFLSDGTEHAANFKFK